MSTCWKCGRGLPTPQTECEEGSGCNTSAVENQSTPPSVANWLREQMLNRVQLDWEKVKTPEDLLIVLRVMFSEVTIDRRSKEAIFLARYLKDGKVGTDTNTDSGADAANPS